MTDWSELRDAYGAASAVPALLGKVTPDLSAPAWDELWSRLCHQGTVYPASYAALPALAELARAWAAVDRAAPLGLAAAIVIARETVSTSRQSLAPTLRSDLRRLALEWLYAEARHPSEIDTTDAWLDAAQAVLAFEDVEPWGAALDRLADGELPATCTACGRDLYLVLSEDTVPFATTEDWVRAPAVRRSPLTPAPTLPPVGAWLANEAVSAGRARYARYIPFLYGAGACVGCGKRFSVEQAVAAALAGPASDPDDA